MLLCKMPGIFTKNLEVKCFTEFSRKSLPRPTWHAMELRQKRAGRCQWLKTVKNESWMNYATMALNITWSRPQQRNTEDALETIVQNALLVNAVNAMLVCAYAAILFFTNNKNTWSCTTALSKNNCFIVIVF